jgi:hypothetical protein
MDDDDFDVLQPEITENSEDFDESGKLDSADNNKVQGKLGDVSVNEVSRSMTAFTPQKAVDIFRPAFVEEDSALPRFGNDMQQHPQRGQDLTESVNMSFASQPGQFVRAA